MKIKVHPERGTRGLKEQGGDTPAKVINEDAGPKQLQDTFCVVSGGREPSYVSSAAAVPALGEVGKKWGVPRFLVTNMKLLRGRFKSARGLPWSAPEVPHVRVVDLLEEEMVDALRRALQDPAQFMETPGEKERTRLGALLKKVERDPGASSVLVAADLLKYLYRIGASGGRLVNLNKESIAFIDGGIRRFDPYEFSSAGPDLPVVTTLPPEELEAVQALSRESGRWSSLEAAASLGVPSLDFDLMRRGEDSSALWVMQVVSNTTGGRHPWLRLVSPDGGVRVLGFGYMDKKPPLRRFLGTMAKGRFSALDPNERLKNKKKITTLPLSSREARHVLDSVLAYQERLLDETKSTESGPGFHLLAQNCATFVVGILAEALNIHVAEAPRELHPAVSKKSLGKRILSVIGTVALFPMRLVAGGFLFLFNGIAVPFGGASGASGERFRHSPLELNRDESIPESQEDWSASLRSVSAQPPMIDSVADMVRVGDTARVLRPFSIQKWQNQETSTEVFSYPGYLAVVDPAVPGRFETPVIPLPPVEEVG